MSRREAAFSPRARRARRFILRKPAASPAVKRRAVRVAPALRGALDLGPAAKAGVDEASRLEARERRRVVVPMLALAALRRIETKAEPCKVVDDRGLVLRLATGAIQVFNAQEQAPVRLCGEPLVQERRIGVAEMERPVRRRGEPQDGRGREGFIGHGGKAHAQRRGPRNPGRAASAQKALSSRPADRR